MNINFLKEKREAERLTQAEMAKALDMQPQSWYKIEKGVNNLNPAHFDAVSRLLHVTVDELKQYAYTVKMAKREDTLDRIGWVTSLPEEDYNNIVNAYENRELDPDCILNGDNAVPVTYVPLVSEAAAASCSPGVCMPLIDCVSAYSEEKVPFESAQEGDFSIRVVGTSMQPWYPPGTLLLCRPEQRITNGKRVIAVTDDGEIIFKVFARGVRLVLSLPAVRTDFARFQRDFFHFCKPPFLRYKYKINLNRLFFKP